MGEEYNYLAGGVLDVITLTGTVFISDFKWHYNPEMREDAMQTYASIENIYESHEDFAQRLHANVRDEGFYNARS